MRIFLLIMVFVFGVGVVVPSVTYAQDRQEQLDALFEQLQTADDSNWEALETEIWELWARSGSDAMDLLLQRGQDALESGKLDHAISHLSALTDHAPNFAEGWNARATAFYLAGELGLSLDDIARTLVLEPRHFGALTGLGLILEELGDDVRALDAYRHALAIHPQSDDIKGAVARLEQKRVKDI
ncbi:Tetratricopeptide repeat-containing protein [Aliiroseovarius halocynthiae]|uniref:tetratricopeptide repeat protein n=1 Tax=Aliiroseovarius halocynthiae TaxID=985055 RepID=UPI001FE93620|nr:tetratricopeptide repeat protein [Aliiroseovarius halocynthiae]SMR71771.1 Tetratricopeptide repeat-containing protein [Aliiroseovarius halocynthiae]